MNRYILGVIVAGILFGLTGCDTTEPEGEADFALYFLADETLGAYEAGQQGIANLELEAEPWLSAEDIRLYDFSTHCIYLKTDKRDFFPDYDGDGRAEFALIDKPFVVVAGGSRCYIGALHSGLLSMGPAGPYMDELDIWYYPIDVMHISRSWSSDEDVRSMDQIEEALKTAGLFHGGLDLSLEAVSVIENADIATIQYTYTIRNRDEDDLWILDPDRMGSARFHYFTNGVVFWSEDTHYLESTYKDVITPDPYDSWEVEWFTKIKAGESLQRTVQLRGYPRIPDGSYDCHLGFSNPPRIEREDRYDSRARYWLGAIRSDEIVVVVN